MLFEIHRRRGDAVGAQVHAERTLAIRERALAPSDPLVGAALNNLGQLYVALGRTSDAEKAFQRTLAIYEPLADRAYDLATAMEGLAQVYRLQERHVDAEAQLRRALDLLTTAAPDSPFRAELLSTIGDTLIARSEYERALVELEGARVLAEALSGPSSGRVANVLGTIGTTYGYMGNYPKAIEMFERSLAIWARLPDGGLTPLVMTNNLGQTLSEYGEYGRALEQFKISLAGFKQLLGERHAYVGSVLLNTAVVLGMLGNTTEARELVREALAILDAATPGAPTVANAAGILAGYEDDAGDAAAAQALHERSITINQKLRGPANRITGEALGALGGFYLRHGKLAEADAQLVAALDAITRSETPNHPSAFETRSLLGQVRWLRGRGDAEALLRDALREGEAALGPDHPRLVATLNRLAAVLAASDRESEALLFRQRSIQIRSRELALRLAIGSERQKLEAFQLVDAELRTVISQLVRRFKTDAASRVALDLVLRRKGRVLDAMSQQLQAVRARLDDGHRELLDQLDATRAYLSALTIKGPAGDRARYDAKRAELAARLDDLEAKLGAAGSALVRDRDDGLDEVQRALPEGTALVELVRYRDTDVQATTSAAEVGAARYIAFVLHQSGPPAWVDLGDATVIEDAVAAMRRSLGDPSSQDVPRTTRALDQLVMHRVRPLLRDVRSVFVAPDGSLNLVPFGVLRDERGRYLVEDFQFTYLNTGRDLVRLERRVPPRQPALLVGAPEFGRAVAGGATRAADFRVQFTPLPGTATELTDLARLMPAARSLRGRDATEERVKAIAGPAILHVASHGFFLADEEIRPGSRGLVRVSSAGAPSIVENPLLRSGLALAGANGGPAWGDADSSVVQEDGILTALEVSGLDLRGTQLVVLSACDTGVGDVRNGNGVFGLRRALVTAGAETQVMSLWKVDDGATHELMISYYRALVGGRGRSEALRDAQRAIARQPGRAHPYFWGSFIVSGDGRSLDGQPAVLPPVRRGPRGCACGTAGDPAATSVLLVAVGVALRRRRPPRRSR
jgi:MYXO-CTERM domain-containing protein